MTTLTLQPDATAGIDAYVASSGPDTNTGTVAYIGAGSIRTALIKFDLSSLVGKTIQSGTLSLFVYILLPSGTVTANRILSASGGWTEAGATWNYAVNGVTRWAGDAAGNGGADAGCSVSGVDYSATLLSSKAISGESVGTEIQFTLDAAELGAMVAANYGIRLGWSGASATAYFHSSDGATANLRPKLVVDYTDPGAGGILQSAVFHSGIFGTSVR